MDRLFNAFLSSAFGSDELQSYSAEYTWLANQMAHAMMGFFLAALLSWLLRSRNGDKSPHIAVGLLPFLIPLLKVLPDALVVAKQSTLPVSWAEFFADKATDLSFWYIGMFAGLLLFFPAPDGARWSAVRFSSPGWPCPPGWCSSGRPRSGHSTCPICRRGGSGHPNTTPTAWGPTRRATPKWPR
jgi:hypothetical protein